MIEPKCSEAEIDANGRITLFDRDPQGGHEKVGELLTHPGEFTDPILPREMILDHIAIRDHRPAVPIRGSCTFHGTEFGEMMITCSAFYGEGARSTAMLVRIDLNEFFDIPEEWTRGSPGRDARQ